MTLLEMVVSMAIITLMLGAVSSAVVIAGRAVERQSPSSFDATASVVVLDLILSEASLATAITEYTSTAITFVLPDRTGDLADETVRYSWSGTVGDPIVRQFNTDAPVPVSGGIRLLAFEFGTATSLEVLTGAKTITTGVELAFFYDNFTWSTQNIDPSNSISQYVRPSFAEGTVSWKVTSIDLNAQKAGGGQASGSLLLELRTPTIDGLPDAEVHSTVSVLESDLPKWYAWTTHTFTDAPTLAPGDAICIVVSDSAGEVSAEFPFAPAGSSRSFAAHGDTASSTWTKMVANDGAETVALSTFYRIRGTIVTQPPDTSISHTLLMRISAELESVSGEIARGATSVFNHPELP